MIVVVIVLFRRSLFTTTSTFRTPSPCNFIQTGHKTKLICPDRWFGIFINAITVERYSRSTVFQRVRTSQSGVSRITTVPLPTTINLIQKINRTFASVTKFGIELPESIQPINFFGIKGGLVLSSIILCYPCVFHWCTCGYETCQFQLFWKTSISFCGFLLINIGCPNLMVFRCTTFEFS